MAFAAFHSIHSTHRISHHNNAWLHQRWSSPQRYNYLDDDNDDDNDAFIMEQLARIESMDQIMEELIQEGILDIDDDDDDAEGFDYDNDDNDNDDIDDFRDLFNDEFLEFQQQQQQLAASRKSVNSLEQALMQGVVPVSAGVGSGCIPGDLGFDPLELSTKDYIGRAQTTIWNFGSSKTASSPQPLPPQIRPSALILRDYREAEIRHGRLAMLAAVLWPIQEMLDRLLLDEDQFGPILYSGITLPYIPLFMTALMLLLGYLDIYSAQMKEQNDIGEAFAPGDCFWDPLCILEGGNDRMKRNMSEREIWNGRMAMLAVVLYAFEEVTSHQPLITLASNSLLFEPAYEIPAIQAWLDEQFSSPSTSNIYDVDVFESVQGVIPEGTMSQQE